MIILRYVFTITSLIFIGSTVIAANSTALSNTSTQTCQMLTCVRKNIDLIDTKIVKLIGLRLTYVKRAGELKKNTFSIHDQARENRVLANVTNQAEKAGYSGSIASAIFKSILLQSNIYEKKIRSNINK